MTASSSIDKTVEVTYCAPETEVGFFHLATVFRLIPYRLTRRLRCRGASFHAKENMRH